MATRRRLFVPPGQAKRSDREMFLAFVKALLDGSITAIDLHVIRPGQGPVRLEYDDPNGAGGPGGPPIDPPGQS